MILKPQKTVKIGNKLFNIKLNILYDGSFFEGFQKQKKRITVQGELEKALLKIYKKPVKVIGSSRTDSGAHAISHTVNYKTDIFIPESGLITAINSYSHKGLSALSAEYISPEFHSRHDAVSRLYRYHIYIADIPVPFLENYALYQKNELDLNLMKEAGNYLIGKHNFSQFQVNDTTVAVRNMFDFDINTEKIKMHWGKALEFIILTYRADSFLRGMIRKITGTLIKVGEGKISLKEFKDLVDNKKDVRSGNVVTASGLYLVRTEY